ncbi:MAG: AbrB/MazE/SpoVT family DNA-binding domain-containing protein [Nanoarchaeota archaeon]
MEALTKTRKIGGSLVVTIPKEIVEQEGLVENQAVRIDVKKMKKSGFGMFKSLGTFTKKDKFVGQLENNE